MGLSDFFQNTKNNFSNSKLGNLLNNDYKNIDYVKNMPALKPVTPELPNIQIEEGGAPTVNTNVSMPQKLSLKERIFGVQPINTLDDTSNEAGAAISTGLQSSPPRGGFLRDFADGYKDNRFNSFSIDNLSPSKKGFAERFGEGLGTALRFAESPVGRGLITAGAIGAFGGSPLQMAGYGASAGVVNQNLRTADSLYRNSLQEQGFDTSKIRGYLNDSTFKNYSLANYRNRNLDVKLAIARSSLDEKQKARLQKGFTDGIYSANDVVNALNDPELLNTNFGLDKAEQLKKSNATRNTDTNEYLAPYKANAYNSGAFASLMNANTNAARLNNKGRLPAAQAAELGATKQGIEQMNDLIAQIPELPSRLTTPGSAQLSTFNPYDSDAQAFQQYVKTYKQVIGKGLEGGVLRKEDETKYEQIIPKVGDTRKTLLKKAEQLQQMLIEKYDMNLDAFNRANYDVSNFNQYHTLPGSKKTYKVGDFTVEEL